MGSNSEATKSVALFESRKIRRTWHNERWYFVVEDVVLALIDSNDTKQYIQRMRERDEQLSQGWVQIVHTLDIMTKGGRQKMICADLEGIFRIIQSIPSPKAEPFKQWLARVGKERIDEIHDPELAVNRAKAIYERKGYPKSWIDKRMRGINVRNTLTDEWKERGATTQNEYAILTDEIYRGTFDMTAQKYKKHKSLGKENNLRDHMNDIELILTMLGEATTTKISIDKNSQGFGDLKKDAGVGGAVAGRTRKDIEKQTGTKTISQQNYLSQNTPEELSS